MKRQNIRIPGPTACPPEVLRAMSRQMINHRGPEFAELIGRVTERLKRVFETNNDVLLLTASGTGGLEAAVVNTLSPYDRVLALSCGVFGERFAAIAEAYGANVVKMTAPYGSAINPDRVAAVLEHTRNSNIKAVLVTHNETSTGVENPLREIAEVGKAHGKLLLVDAVSSLGAVPVRTDAWGLDVVVTASQKGWMTPPGLAMVSVSPAAWEAYEKARMGRFYFDLMRAKQYLGKGQTPWTPAVSTLYGLDEALKRMLGEGMERIHAFHKAMGEMVRKGVRELGLELFARGNYSSTVTAVKVPEGWDGGEIVRRMRERGVVVAGGQGILAGRIFRIAHLGWMKEEDIDGALRALRRVLQTRKAA